MSCSPSSHSDFSDVAITCGSAYITESESSNESNNELLSKVRNKLLSQIRHDSNQSSRVRCPMQKMTIFLKKKKNREKENILVKGENIKETSWESRSVK